MEKKFANGSTHTHIHREKTAATSQMIYDQKKKKKKHNTTHSIFFFSMQCFQL